MTSATNTVLITGGTTGLGYQAALSIAQQRPEYLVVIASRSDKASAAKSINDTLKQQNVIFVPLDLEAPSNVRSFVQSWDTKGYPPLIALLLNAGLQFPGAVQFSANGLESTFAINNYGNALLFHLLYPKLAKGARIIVTASGTHDPAQKTGVPDAKFTTAEEAAHPNPKTANKDGRERYASSKLANILWTYALNRRLGKVPDKSLAVNAFDPGLMPGTGLAREYNAFMRGVWNHVLPRMLPVMRFIINSNIHTTKVSGQRLARLAIAEDVKGISGAYYEGDKQIKSSTVSYDVAKQEDLWNWMVKNLAESKEESAKFDIGA